MVLASEFLAPAVESFAMPAVVVDYENAEREREEGEVWKRDCQRESKSST